MLAKLTIIVIINRFIIDCRYWQEYANLWHSFMNEAVRQKHQIEMLQMNRLPSEETNNPDEISESSCGTARVSQKCCKAFTKA